MTTPYDGGKVPPRDMTAETALSVQRKQQDEAAITLLEKTWADLCVAQLGVRRLGWRFSRLQISSMRRFLKHLPWPDVEVAMETAHSRIIMRTSQGDERVWKYFCGVCWRRIQGDNEQ
jgi:hypothetical protein